MRKIGSSTDEEKKRKRNVLLLSLLLLFLMIISSAGYAFLSGDGLPDGSSQTNEEGTTTLQGDRYVVTHNGRSFYFTNSPDSVSDIQVDTTLTLTNYLGKKLYIDSKNSAVTQEIGSAFSGYASRISDACYGSCPERDIPEKTCEENIIIWKDSQQNKIYQEDNCVFIEGDLRAVDALLFKILEIKT